MGFSDLWRWQGTIGRGPYAAIGLIGFALKHNLDRLLATLVFHRPWSMFNYWIPLDRGIRITELARRDAEFLAAMVLLALPFIWVGVVLTARRLRAAGLPVPLVILFFLPVFNVVFFAILCLIPSKDQAQLTASSPEARSGWLARILPESAPGSAAVAIILTGVVGFAFTLLSTQVLNRYGWGLFVALPFCLGMAAVFLYGYQQPRGFWGCMGVACLAVLLLGLVLLSLAIEGAICLAMAAPLTCLLAMLGGSIGYFFQREHWARRQSPAMLSVVLLFAPGFLFAEHVSAPQPPVFAVRTSIVIAAPPEAVWSKVIEFARIPEPTEWVFRAGIAYPVQAEILGRGPGAERHCVFSTGAFVEPIEVWDEPRLLKFSVTSNPAPMQEWTPYARITPPHLRGFLVSQGGQFLLTPLRGGRTRLEGTTWYRHTMWPAGYWRLWSDFLIHRIHLRVLRHIARLAETR